MIHSFGNSNKPVMILIHGMLTPWEIWLPHIEFFSKNYYVIVPELGGHGGNGTEQFSSIEDECIKIERYLKDSSIDNVFAVCGLSFGGVVAYELWNRKQINISKLVLDGAPLYKMGKLLQKVMTANYISIVEKSRERDKKTLQNFSKFFLPEEYLQQYLKVADHISPDSISNIIDAIAKDMLEECANLNKVLYIHGTDMNEYLSKKSAKILREKGLKSVHCFSGDAHCYKAIYKPIEWCKVVEEFLNR